MSRFARLALVALLALFVAASPARATEASDAYKRAKDLKKKVDRAGSEAELATAERDLADYVEQRSAALSGAELSRMDLAYLGLMQGLGGMKAEAVASLKRSLDHPAETKYVSNIYNYYIGALVDNGQASDALKTLLEMNQKFEGEKNTKRSAMTVGMALRGARMWEESAKALGIALKAKDPAALKPMVKSLMMAGQRDAAVKSIEWAIEKAGEAGRDPDHQVLLETTKKIGEPVTLEFDGFTPGDPPDMAGKVVVMGFWNVSAGTLRWTMGLLQSIFEQYPPKDGVITLGVSTYYKKNPDTGLIEEDMAPEVEREIGDSYRRQYGFAGQLAYTKDEAGLKALGITALPHVVIVGKDGKLLYAYTVYRDDPTEIEVIREIIEKAMR